MKCNQCGTENYSIGYLPGDIKRLMDLAKVCFTCAFWLDMKRKHKDDPLWCRIDGRSYWPSSVLKPGQLAASQSPRSGFKGFGGREFCIRFHDGRLIRTDNLWTQGEMPDWLREVYPDNAEFIKHEEYYAIL